MTESGFVRVSSNPRVLPSPIGVESARQVLIALRGSHGHRFLRDDVSIIDADVPAVSGYRQVTDAHLLTLAHRRGMPLITFDSGAAALGAKAGVEVELLHVL
jgi:predicted nucleic acid-binding protein